jgi:hypothetical protein
MLLGHDVFQNSTLHINDSPPFIEIQQHLSRNRFCTYMQGVRTRTEFAPIYLTCIKSNEARTFLFAEYFQSIIIHDSFLLSESHSVTPEENSYVQMSLLLASRLHFYSHASVRDLRRLIMRVNMLAPERERELRKTVDNCAICVQVGRSTPSRKVSPARVVAKFSQTVHVDFKFISLRNVPLALFHIVDSATAYSTAHIVPSRDLDHAAHVFESQWISGHVALSSLAADPEFSRTGFKNLLAAHHIVFAERPARRHQKTGCAERKNGVLRPILYRIALADSSSPLFVIVARGIIFRNELFGNRLCSSLELGRGYDGSGDL